MTMGEKILNMRKARGWSQEELAEKIGVTRQAVSRWESGSAKPDADKIIAVCDLFGVSADYLLRESYAGEGPAPTEVSPKNDKHYLLNAGQIFGMLLVALAIVMVFVVAMLASIYPHTMHMNGVDYRGFVGYIMCNDLEWLMYVCGGMASVGLLLFCWTWIVAFCKRKSMKK